MTAVLAAADSKYIARITCLKDKDSHIDCDLMSRVAWYEGRKHIPGIIDCKVRCDKELLHFDVVYKSENDPSNVLGKLYAIAIIVSFEHPGLKNMTAIDVDVEKIS